MMHWTINLHYLPLLLAISLEEFIESDHLILVVFRVLGASIGHRHHITELSTNHRSATKLMIQAPNHRSATTPMFTSTKHTTSY